MAYAVRALMNADDGSSDITAAIVAIERWANILGGFLRYYISIIALLFCDCAAGFSYSRETAANFISR